MKRITRPFDDWQIHWGLRWTIFCCAKMGVWILFAENHFVENHFVEIQIAEIRSFCFRRSLFSIMNNSIKHPSRERPSTKWTSAIAFIISTILLSEVEICDFSKRYYFLYYTCWKCLRNSDCSNRDHQYTISLRRKFVRKNDNMPFGDLFVDDLISVIFR